MQKCSISEFTKFMSELKKVLPKYAPDLKDDGLIEAWYGSLKILTVDQLREAYIFFRDNVDVFPSIKKIRVFATFDEKPKEIVENVNRRNEMEWKRWELKQLESNNALTKKIMENLQ